MHMQRDYDRSLLVNNKTSTNVRYTCAVIL